MLTSVLTGVAGALGAGVLALVVAFAFGFVRVWWDFGDGTGEIGAYSMDVPGLSTLVAMAVGFALGFYWRFRRS
jgi:hypothetical protein